MLDSWYKLSLLLDSLRLANKNEGIIIPTRQRIKVNSTVDAPFAGIDASSAMKVNGPTFAPEAEDCAEIQEPVLEIVEY